MENHLGRPLKKTEVVHHKDHNKINNSIKNLEVISTQAEHVANHFQGYRTKTKKECRMCHTVKDRDYFYKDNRGGYTDANDVYCKKCRDGYSSKYVRRKRH